MAKGQLKGNKEAKKPKSDKPKEGGSAYKLSQGKGGQALTPRARRRSRGVVVRPASPRSHKAIMSPCFDAKLAISSGRASGGSRAAAAAKERLISLMASKGLGL